MHLLNNLFITLAHAYTHTQPFLPVDNIALSEVPRSHRQHHRLLLEPVCARRPQPHPRQQNSSHRATIVWHTEKDETLPTCGGEAI